MKYPTHSANGGTVLLCAVRAEQDWPHGGNPRSWYVVRRCHRPPQCQRVGRSRLVDSGLLAALGLTQVVHDWDVTTDGPAPIVEGALEAAGFSYREAPAGVGVYATAALLHS